MLVESTNQKSIFLILLRKKLIYENSLFPDRCLA
jgi:hypothetical protein